MAYFNNAATSYPKPEEMYSCMDAFYRNNGISAGRNQNNSIGNVECLIKETRNLIKEVLSCPSKEVIFEPSATIALNIIIQGVIATGVKNVYISPFEHNSVTRVLHSFEKKGVINVHTLKVSAKMVYDLERIKYQFQSIKPDFVIMSHASNVFGLISPVEEIFLLAKRYNAITLADMSQTAGLVKCYVDSEVFDFAVFAGHKTLYGPTGISGFVMKPNLQFPPILFGGTGYDSANLDMPESLPERYEIGTTNVLGIIGLNASLKWIKKITIDSIFEHEIDCRKKLIDLLNEFEFIKVIGDFSNCNYVGVVSCLLEGISSDSAGDIFERCGIVVRTGLHCSPLSHKFMNTFPAGTIRFSVSYFTTQSDLDELRKALEYIEENL